MSRTTIPTILVAFFLGLFPPLLSAQSLDQLRQQLGASLTEGSLSVELTRTLNNIIDGLEEVIEAEGLMKLIELENKINSDLNTREYQTAYLYIEAIKEYIESKNNTISNLRGDLEAAKLSIHRNTTDGAGNISIVINNS